MSNKLFYIDYWIRNLQKHYKKFLFSSFFCFFFLSEIVESNSLSFHSSCLMFGCLVDSPQRGVKDRPHLSAPLHGYNRNMFSQHKSNHAHRFWRHNSSFVINWIFQFKKIKPLHFYTCFGTNTPEIEKVATWFRLVTCRCHCMIFIFLSSFVNINYKWDMYFIFFL